MKNIIIYTKSSCGYCHRAKMLLESKKQNFREIDIGADPGQRQVMIDRAYGGNTVPQIFIGDQHVGGCDELYALERAGKLDSLLLA